MTREQYAVAIYRAFTAVLNARHEDELPAIHADLLAAADEYQAHGIEQHARAPRSQQDQQRAS